MIRYTELDSIADIDAMIHNPARLMIVYLLARNPSIDYLELMEKTKLTSGNITTHLGKLSSVGYIRIRKSFRGNKPHTSVSLTPKGEEAYSNWSKSILAALSEKTSASLRFSVVASVMNSINQDRLHREIDLNFVQAYMQIPEGLLRGYHLPQMLAPNRW